MLGKKQIWIFLERDHETKSLRKSPNILVLDRARVFQTGLKGFGLLLEGKDASWRVYSESYLLCVCIGFA